MRKIIRHSLWEWRSVSWKQLRTQQRIERRLSVPLAFYVGAWENESPISAPRSLGTTTYYLIKTFHVPLVELLFIENKNRLCCFGKRFFSFLFLTIKFQSLFLYSVKCLRYTLKIKIILFLVVRVTVWPIYFIRILFSFIIFKWKKITETRLLWTGWSKTFFFLAAWAEMCIPIQTIRSMWLTNTKCIHIIPKLLEYCRWCMF